MDVKVEGFNIGTVVSLHYKADADTKQVVMNFLSGPESTGRILHFNPRYHQKKLVLNTRKDVSSGWPWGEEETPSGFPFEIDKEVHVTVEAESDGFLIKCDEHSFRYKFNYRMPVTNIHHISVSLASGTLKIENASYLGIVNPQSNKSIKDGESVRLSVSSIQSGSQPLSFNWKKDNGDLTDTSKYSGVDGSNLKINSFSAKEQGKYSCTVSNGRWSVESGSAELALATDSGKENENVTAPKSAIKSDDSDPIHHKENSKKFEEGVIGIKSTGPGIDKANCPESASASPKAFCDTLSPIDLVAWLSQQFQAKGLTLDASLRQKLIDDDINGAAFMHLKDKYLDETKFKPGQCMNILQIIQSLKDGKKETPPKPVPVEPPSDTPVLSISTLTLLRGKGKVVEIIKEVTPKWKVFGQHLNFDLTARYLDTIEKKYNKDPADCCRDMFTHWLNGNGVEATWENVTNFLDAVGLRVLAKDIKAIIE